ncbi:TetR/AcrR family transcriptional regulator [Nocardia blacklockiae]|uniref:TetR/AcrR family transcriptional regulator n=1 Tax=Nocardia blacklockiae TaxID=480036 RepID=UPI001895895A|nr:TetR/AcrR family transcriptional regulator [Nocardia blacklockiae]MBF6175921.1 TetR/AcrR family transcriptional regulator [Nocardia blacklockiae]
MAAGQAGATPRGRIDKRQAILDAAFQVFARKGFEQACVQDIAAAAGVAKPTVYNHLTDKHSLLRESIAVVADAVGADCVAVLERLRNPGDDLPALLEDVAYRLLRICNDDRSRALRRLAYGQAAGDPGLVELARERTGQRTLDALSDRLARLALSGRLRTADPAVAAEQFLALLTAPVENRSRMGTRTVRTTELRTIAAAAVTTFLAAYGADAG